MPRGTTRLAVVLHILKDQPWGARVKRDIESVLLSHPSIQAEYVDAGGDPIEQVRLVDEFLKSGIDALIVMPIDAARIRAVLKKHRALGVPVIVVGLDLGDDQLYHAQILGNHRQFGRE